MLIVKVNFCVLIFRLYCKILYLTSLFFYPYLFSKFKNLYFVHQEGGLMLFISLRFISYSCCVTLICLVSLYCNSSTSFAAKEGDTKRSVSTSNVSTERYQKRMPKKKWRAIYVEGGAYTDYQQILAATARSFAKLGLIENGNVPISIDTNNTKPMWDWLTDNAGTGKIEFLKDGFYSGDWDGKKRIDNKAAILKRINEQDDIDLIFAFGTPAGLDMATNEHSIPTFSMSVTDAVLAGIVTSVEDSGRDHVQAQIEIGRYERQLTMFYDVFQFARLGVPYADTPEGRASVAVKVIQETADELGFEIVPCLIARYADEDIVFNSLKQCMEGLSETSDAIYLTANHGMRGDSIAELLQPLIDKKIPSFSQSGLEETKLGVLMSVAQNSFENEGMHGAKAVAAVIAGAKPRDLPQGFTGPLGVAINSKMAEHIGWSPPFNVLATINKIYHEMGNTK